MVEGPRTWHRREGLLGGLEGQPLIAKPAWGVVGGGGLCARYGVLHVAADTGLCKVVYH